nr:MAG TPA: hypothetical protein [Caudoviricetes sp.]
MDPPSPWLATFTPSLRKKTHGGKNTPPMIKKF